MKLQYLPDGSPDCPLLRIYDFDGASACRLREVFIRLGSGISQPIALHELPIVESVDACRLVLSVGQKDEGVIPAPEPPAFECRLTPYTWRQAAKLAEPFCQDARLGTHQWLDETSEVSLLLSPSGQW